MTETSLFEKCPSTLEEWTEAASKGELLAVSPRDYTDHKHGSEITQPQFIILRTLVQASGPDAFDPTLFDLDNDIEKARSLLQDWDMFKHYIDAIKANSCKAVGDFSAARFNQVQVLEAHKGPVQARDEELEKPPVRYSAMILLMCICGISPNEDSSRWCTISRINLVAKFGSGKGSGFIAGTDGQMQDKSHSLWIKAPMKSTSNERHVYGPAIYMQEAALLVAWMKEYPGYPGPKRRILISQNGIEFYLTFAVCGDDWMTSYVEEGNTEVTDSSFMTMHTYGPWLINNAEHMEEFASIILAISF